MPSSPHGKANYQIPFFFAMGAAEIVQGEVQEDPQKHGHR